MAIGGGQHQWGGCVFLQHHVKMLMLLGAAKLQRMRMMLQQGLANTFTETLNTKPSPCCHNLWCWSKMLTLQPVMSTVCQHPWNLYIQGVKVWTLHKERACFCASTCASQNQQQPGCLIRQSYLHAHRAHDIHLGPSFQEHVCDYRVPFLCWKCQWCVLLLRGRNLVSSVALQQLASTIVHSQITPLGKVKRCKHFVIFTFLFSRSLSSWLQTSWQPLQKVDSKARERDCQRHPSMQTQEMLRIRGAPNGNQSLTHTRTITHFSLKHAHTSIRY